MSSEAVPTRRPHAGLRERKKAATRQALGLAAMRLAIERGLDNVLVEDIAAEAGVSPRTFNNYFASKYEAICALAVDRARHVGQALRARPDSEPLWDAITHAVLRQYTGADQAPEGWIAGVRLVTKAPALQGEYLKAQAVMRDVLAEAIAERVGADSGHEMLPRILADAVATATEVATDRWLIADQPASAPDLVRQALRQLSGYLRLPDTTPQPANPHKEHQ
ncbi:TetR family transcriptional regulator [Acrocarpospora pleiomorpha]|uniref:TetR family transcriptional regulator n=1 Tax=Acrocarpospora pleiomorpha TaxID=90975 RepID=A0A5M3XEC8_9ACTN|nr:TetR family transcriptional regulator [Acrocarpospora pleiomorpha]GES18976.1 TetR family transcriptional regulator [Acrocarpospora pleiomorpha]